MRFEPNPIANGSMDSAAPPATLLLEAASGPGGTRAFTEDGTVELTTGGAALATLTIGRARAAAAARLRCGGGGVGRGAGDRAQADASVLSACATWVSVKWRQ